MDDNKDIRWLLSNAFSDSFRVLEASGLEEAEAILDKSVPDIIITDVVMGGKDDGFELVRKLRADKYRRSIPVIVCSARVAEQDQIEGMDSGADAYFTKPFSVSVVKATAERLLSNRKMLKDWYDAPESARTIVNSKVMHNPDKEFVEKAILSMKENLTEENFNLERLADLMGLSSRNFYRRFKKITGQTPSEFMKQKLSIAAAMAHSPKLLLLDEPTGGLDPVALCSLRFQPGGGVTLSLATDGDTLYYDGAFLADRYLRSRTAVDRAGEAGGGAFRSQSWSR